MKAKLYTKKFFKITKDLELKKIYYKYQATDGIRTLTHTSHMTLRISPYSLGHGATLENLDFAFLNLSIFHQFLRCNHILNC